MTGVEIDRDDPRRPDVVALLLEHLADMFATSPAESVHALEPAALDAPGISFWTAREDGILLGCGALKRHAGNEGELKSMRTAQTARGRGVASMILARILDEARAQGLRRVNLETGTEEYFGPARRLYRRRGFVERGPFADYRLDPNSIYLTLDVHPSPPRPA